MMAATISTTGGAAEEHSPHLYPHTLPSPWPSKKHKIGSNVLVKVAMNA